MSLVGQRSKKRYRIGDTVKVKVKSASKEEAFIDFEIMIEEGEEGVKETKKES